MTAVDETAWCHAEQLLLKHPLRTYDAVQLASALELAAALTLATMDFRLCTADRAQAEAAEREGLTVELIA